MHLFLCFAPQMAQLGFFIELSFSHKLYDFPTTLCRKRESNLCRQICTSLRDLDSRRLQMLSTTAVVVADKRAFPVESLTKCSHLLLVFYKSILVFAFGGQAKLLRFFSSQNIPPRWKGMRDSNPSTAKLHL